MSSCACLTGIRSLLNAQQNKQVAPAVNLSRGLLADGRFKDTYELLAGSPGSGVSGVIRLARRRNDSTGALVAVKTLSLVDKSALKVQAMLREIEIHSRMEHDHVARVLEVFSEPGKLILILEYCDGGSLAQLLLSDGAMSEERAATFTRQLLMALDYCHRHPEGKVAHRDLKPANVVSVNGGEGVKLIDFGLASDFKEQSNDGCVGTLYFMAPEVVRRKGHDETCDLWSLGVIVYYLLSGKAPFLESTEAGTVCAIISGSYKPMEGGCWAGISDAAKSFISSLLQVDPRRRPTAERAMTHPWLNQQPFVGTAGRLQ